MPAAPTESEIHGQLQAVADWAYTLYAAGSVSSDNLLGMEDAAVQALEGNYSPEAVNSIRALNRHVGGAISQVALQSIFDPIAREYGHLYKFTESGGARLWRKIYRYWADQGTPITLKRRNPSFGTLSAGGGNTGNAVLNRLTTDADGYTLQNVYPEAHEAKCSASEHSGAQKHRAMWQFHGQKRDRTDLSRTGSGATADIEEITPETSSRYIGNPSFHLYEGTTSVPTDITDWTVGSSIANFEIDTSVYYRDSMDEATPSAVKIKANDSLTQSFSVRNAQFEPDPITGEPPPIYVQAAYYRDGDDGSLTMDFGGVQEQVADLTAVADTTWLILRLALGTKNWFANFNETDADLVFTLASHTTGNGVRLDDLIIAPMTYYAGTWWAPVGGTTKTLRDDIWTWTDAISTDSKIMALIAWAYDISMPTAASPVVADP